MSLLAVVAVLADYILNIIARADMYNDFIYGIFRFDVALFGFSRSGCFSFALCKSWASPVVPFTLLTYIITIFGHRIF